MDGILILLYTIVSRTPGATKTTQILHVANMQCLVSLTNMYMKV